MKLNIKLIAVVLTVFSAATSSAGEVDSIAGSTFCKVVVQDDEKLYKLIYQSLQRNDVTIQFFDQEKQLVHTENVKGTEGFIKRYDLTNLPVGKYRMEVKTPDYFYSKEIDLGGLEDFNIVLSGRKGTREVALVGSHPEGKDMTLFILDQNQDVLYRELFDETFEVKKKYNLEQIDSDEVTFVIYHRDNVIKEEVFGF